MYRYLVLNPDCDIDFLYGGRDSGKSYAIAQALLHMCREESYFRCVLIRKVYATIRDSQWQMLRDIVDNMGLTEEFTFTKYPLEIKCSNGNKFIARGCDEPQKLKSITNPSCCWIEEGNQLTEEDFTIIQTTLRSNSARVRIFFSFNPECEGDYTTFWLYRNWFGHTTDSTFEHQRSYHVRGKEITYKYRATHSTYKNNPFVTPERIAVYESYATTNGYYYNVYTLGQWGYRVTGGEFWKEFRAEKHIRTIALAPATIHVVVDNNVSPYVTVALWQLYDKELLQVHELPCASPDNNAPRAARRTAAWLTETGYKDVVFVYGDPSANARSTVDENSSSFFDKFTATLRQCGYVVSNRVGKSAPEVALSGAFINEIYGNNLFGYNITINSSCRTSIEDYTMAKENAEGGILKKRTTNKDTGISYERYGHFSDAKRYFITTVLRAEFESFMNKDNRVYGIYTFK